jgi:hypothetical protein
MAHQSPEQLGDSLLPGSDIVATDIGKILIQEGIQDGWKI